MIIYCYNYNYNYNITQLYSKKTNYKSFTYFGNKIIFYYQHVFIIYISYNGILVNHIRYPIKWPIKFCSCKIFSA